MTDKAKLEEIKKLADAMYYAAFNLTTDASLLRKAMNEYHQFVIHKYCKEEPVSEDKMTISKEWFEHCKKSWYNEGYIDGKYNRDRQFKETVSEGLGEYVNELSKQFPEVSFAKLSRIAVRVAKWQKEQINEVLLSEVLPCFMHGGEADEVVAKLEEVLNQKK